MAGREWMYKGWTKKRQSPEWVHGTNEFLSKAFGPTAKGSDQARCPCNDCKNQKRKVFKDVYKDLLKHGYVANYERWIFHGEPKATIREEEVRARLDEFEGDAGVADMVVDFNEGRGNEGLVEEDPEETAKAFYEMMSSAQKPLHEKTTKSQLDAIGRLLGLKSQLSLSRDGFNLLLAVVGSLLPDDHTLPKSTYESVKLLRALKMPYESIHACRNGCVLFRGKELEAATHCTKCKASRYVEVDKGDVKKEQSKIPEMVVRYLPLIPRLQRMFMIEELAKQMIWHKFGKRYRHKFGKRYSDKAPLLICKLEMIFPPGFFLPMQHLILHLPREARLGGPVQARWCYPIERCLKILRKKCRNKARIEASVAEAARVEEVSNFTKAYYTENLHYMHPLPRYNEDENLSTLSLFRGQLGRGSAGNPKTLQYSEWRALMLYLFLSLEEVVPYRV